MAEEKPFFITLGGPKAHLHFGRDDKGEVTVALGNCYRDGRKAGPSTALRFGRDDKFV